jgi:uncharacterized membrane protein YphA (DoxX/SURF4 family)
MKQFFENKIVRFIISAGLAALIFFICPPCLSKWALGTVLLGLLILINGASFFARFSWLAHICRILVGGLFIFSGFIKANDPLGFSYKLEEYFDVFAEASSHSGFLVGLFHLMRNASLFFAILVCVTEVALGFMLLIGFKSKLTLWLLLLQIVFFTFLTFYSACFDKVKTCGCFGDFLVLTPWTSFVKDLALLILITVLFTGIDHIKPIFGTMVSNALTWFFIAASIAFPLYTWYYLPVKDFRAYAPGKNICEEMKPGPKYHQAVYENHFLYKNLKTGKTQEFTNKTMPWQDTLNWAYSSALPNVLLQAAQDEAKVVDFKITDPESGEDLTDSILKNPDYHFILVANEIENTNRKVQGRVNDFQALCEKDKKSFIGLTSSDHEKVRDFRHDVQAMYPYLSCDGTVLKTMIRSNPGLILMKGCEVLATWPYHSLPSYNDVKEKYFGQKK